MVAEDTKARIRAVALELFIAQGYEQTSLREIADRVGLTKASLYYHYPSKQALLLALVQPLVDDWRRAVENAEALPHDPDNIRAALGRFLDIMLRHRSPCALFMRDTPAVLASIEPILNEMIQLMVRLQDWLAGPDPTDVDRIRAVAAGEVLGAVVSSVATLTDVSPALLRQTLLDAAVSLLDLPRQATVPVTPRLPV